MPMNRTNELRKLIKSRLGTVCSRVYYDTADDSGMYPHIVFSYDNIDTGDLHRHDMMVNVDIWDKSKSAFTIETLADRVEDLFCAVNLPQDTILPTFFLAGRKSIPDEDKRIKHRLIKVVVQNYEKE